MPEAFLAFDECEAMTKFEDKRFEVGHNRIFQVRFKIIVFQPQRIKNVRIFEDIERYGRLLSQCGVGDFPPFRRLAGNLTAKLFSAVIEWKSDETSGIQPQWTKNKEP